MVKDHDVLTRAEERELFLRVEDGDESARNEIIEHNLRLIAYVAKRYSKNQDLFDDLFAEGYNILFRAIEKFEVSRNLKFSTYAMWWLRQAMSKYCDNLKKTSGFVRDRHVGTSEHSNNILDIADRAIKKDEDEVPDMMITQEKVSLVRDCLYLLSDREVNIIKRRFGIDCEPETLDEIGIDYDLSKERIRQIQENALLKLRPILSDTK
jgi:RNA polymerase sigma factor (sigma-70 family)